MTDRDELAALISRHCDCRKSIQEGLADAIMASGWMNMGALETDLQDFAEVEPIVKAAQESYDRMVREVTGRRCVDCGTPISKGERLCGGCVE